MKEVSDNLKNNSVVTNLTIGFCKLDDEAADRIGHALRTNSSLKILNLWDNKIAAVGGEGLGKGLAHNSTLQELNLRTNNLGPKGALGLSKGIMQNNSIVRLHLRYNWIGDAGAKALAAVMMSNATITDLDLSRNRIGSDGAEYLMKAVRYNDTLRLLNMQLNTLQDKGGIFVGSALQQNTRLTHLDLMDCMIGDAGCAAIFEALGAATHKSYETIGETKRRRHKVAGMNNGIIWMHVGGNGIGELGSIQIGKALIHNKGITKLDVSRNRISNKGATFLAEALTKNSTLTDLMLKDNLIGDPGAQQLSVSVRTNRHIKALSLSANEMSWKVETDGFVSNTSLSSFENDFNLSRVTVALGGKNLSGFRMDISHARERGKVDQPLDIFPALTRKLLSLHCEQNNIGAESAAAVAGTVGEYLAHSSSLVELSLAKNLLRDEHVKGMAFTSLTLLDLSHNQIGNAGADHVISCFAKLKGGARITEIDFTDNQINKITPTFAYITTLDVLYIEQNPVIGLVPLTATQHGGKAITLWLQKWALQQLHLAEISKGGGMALAKSHKSDSNEKADGKSMESPQKVRGAIVGTEPRFKSVDLEDATPGPADYVPTRWSVDEATGLERVDDVWRRTADFGPKKDHTPRVVHTAGPKVGEPVDVTEDQEFVILEIRIELLEKAFEGMTVMPSRWHSATNPTVVEKAREHRYLQRHVYQHKVQPPGYQEQYGVQSILRRLRHECPFWNLTAQHVIKVLKKHRILHSDDVCYTERPVLDSAPDVWPPGPHVWHPSVLEDEAWTSKVAFYSAVSSVLQGRKYEGFNLWLLKAVDKNLHLKAMRIVREALKDVDWEDYQQVQDASVQIRDLFNEVYLRAYRNGHSRIEDPNLFLQDVRNVFEQPSRLPDETSKRIALTPAMRRLFSQTGEVKLVHRQQMEEELERSLVGPGSYDCDKYDKIGCDPKRGKTIALPIPIPPNGNPGPLDYYPKLPQEDRKIAVHMMPKVGKEPETAIGPGPAYDLPSAFEVSQSTACKLGSKAWLNYLKASEAGTTPGPGTYEHAGVNAETNTLILVEGAGSSAKACVPGPAWSHGMPRPLLPHMDALSSARLTPGPYYASYAPDRTGLGTTIREDKVKPSSPAFSMRVKTPYSGADGWVGAIPSADDIPGPGTYEAMSVTGNPQTLAGRSSPAYSMANDTLGRSEQRLTHTSVMGLGMMGTSTLIPRLSDTGEARTHPTVKRLPVPPLKLRGHELCLSPQSAEGFRSGRSLVRAQTARESGRVQTAREAGRQRGGGGLSPSRSPPRGRTSPRKKEEEPSPGPADYTIKTTMGNRRNIGVPSSPAYTISKDEDTRESPRIFHATDRDWGISVITPIKPQTARARLHRSDENAYSTPVRENETRLARHFLAPTGHTAKHSARRKADEQRSQIAASIAKRKKKTA